MAGLCAREVDAVQQDEGLVLMATTYRDVGLYAMGAALGDIDPSDVDEEILDTAHRRCSDLLSGEDGDELGGLTEGRSELGGCDGDGLDLVLTLSIGGGAWVAPRDILCASSAAVGTR